MGILCSIHFARLRSLGVQQGFDYGPTNSSRVTVGEGWASGHMNRACGSVFLFTPCTMPLPSDFEIDETASLVDNFRRLAIDQGWGKKSKSYKEGKRAFFTEQVQSRFATDFGSNNSSLQSWQSLCHTIGVPNSDSLTSIKRCKQARGTSFDYSSHSNARFLGFERHLRQPC